MATRGQTHNKRARELAIKEKRERKKARRAEAAAQRLAGDAPVTDDADANGEPEVEEQPTPASEWVQ